MPEPVYDANGRLTIVTDNGDGTLNVRVAKGCGDDGGDWLALPEVTARQHAKVKQIARISDESMPQIDPLDADQLDDDALVRRQAEQLEERVTVRDSEESPYGLAFIEIVKLLTGRELTLDEMVVQAKFPGTINAMVRVWETPLAGPAPATIPMTVPESGTTAPDSTPNGHGSPSGTDAADPSHLPSSTP